MALVLREHHSIRSSCPYAYVQESGSTSKMLDGQNARGKANGLVVVAKRTQYR